MDGKQALGPDFSAETAAVDPSSCPSLSPHLGLVIISQYNSVIVQSTLIDLINLILTRYPSERVGAGLI